MRYVSVSEITKGMLLARDLFDKAENVTYKSGAKLGNKEVEHIQKLGYPGVYILDEISDRIVPESFIPQDVRIEAIRNSDRLLGLAKKYQTQDIHVSPEEQEGVVMPLVEALRQNADMLLDEVDLKPYEGYEHYHAANVMILSVAVGIKLGLSDQQLIELGIGALLHDVGNIFLPQELLNRPGKLTDEEFEQIRKHVQQGHDFLRMNYGLPAAACIGALQHHENYDGTGYPGGLKRKEISPYGRIIAITDVYDALVSKRAFRPAMYPMQAMDILQQHADRKFDPDVVTGMDSFITPFPTGVVVKLKSGEECIVARNNRQNLKRPLLKVMPDARSKQEVFIDLANDPAYAQIRITKIV